MDFLAGIWREELIKRAASGTSLGSVGLILNYVAEGNYLFCSERSSVRCCLQDRNCRRSVVCD